MARSYPGVREQTFSRPLDAPAAPNWAGYSTGQPVFLSRHRLGLHKDIKCSPLLRDTGTLPWRHQCLGFVSSLALQPSLKGSPGHSPLRPRGGWVSHAGPTRTKATRPPWLSSNLAVRFRTSPGTHHSKTASSRFQGAGDLAVLSSGMTSPPELSWAG